MRTNLQVPYAEKEQAKRLGARWDPARKVWYIENVVDMAPFSRWMPTSGTHSGALSPSGPGAPVKAALASRAQGANTPITGSNYAPQPRVCNCLPWDVCDKCRASALSY